MADGDSTIQDALQVTRTLHRLIITASLVTIVFSLTLRLPREIRIQKEAIDQFLRFDFLQYDKFIKTKADDASRQWLKPVADEIRTSLESSNYVVFGISDISKAIESPIVLGQFKISETKLATPSEMTIKLLEVLGESYPLQGDLFIPATEASNLIGQIHKFLGDHAKMGMRVQNVKVSTSQNYSDSDPPPEGDTIKMLLVFELMPSGNPPSYWFQGEFDANVKRIPNVSFQKWLLGRPGSSSLVVLQDDLLKWLPNLNALPRELIDRRLGDVFGALNEELKKGSPENKSVSLLGAEIPGILLVYAAPLTLVALAYYFLFHLKHLCHFARAHKVDYERFAWLPLSQNHAWFWESLCSLVVLPILSLGVLSVQLFRFNFLGPAPTLFIVAAAVSLSWLGWRSVRQIRDLRGHLGKTTKTGLWLGQNRIEG